MKKYIIPVIALVFTATAAFAQVDRTKAPAPGPAPKIQIGKAETFTLKNGLKVFVVENHKLPTVSYSLILDNDPVLEGDKAGYVQMVGELLTAGTKSRTKSKLDEEVDFIGANLNASAGGVFGSVLKKHNEKFLELLADVILNPTFPAEEFEKIRKQTLSGLEAEKDEPGAILDNVAASVMYGNKHPYGEIPTEKTIANITVDDIRNYYTKYFMPNVGYLAIVGDITKAEAQPLIEKFFGTWAKGTPVKNSYPKPTPPSSPQIAMFDRPVSVQSSLLFTYPVDLTPGHPDLIKVRVMNEILGGGSRGRLFRNLRETHGYTYGAYSSFSPDRVIGSFDASAEVRTEVTDSAVYEFIQEFNMMASRGVTKDELEAVKKEMTGSFARSLENPQTVANFAITIARYKLPATYYENYLTALNALTVEEINETAKKYILPFNFNLVIVGNREKIEKNLLQYDADQKISYFDNYGKPAGELRQAPDGVTVETVIDQYLTAIGGKDKVNQINDLRVVYSGAIQGMPVEVEVAQKSGKFMQVLRMNGTDMQKEVFDGTQGVSVTAEGKNNMDAKDIEDAKLNAVPVMEAKYKDFGVTATLKGIDIIDGYDAYLVEFVYKNGNKERTWYFTKNGLKARSKNMIVTEEGTQQITTDYSNYAPVDGINFPGLVKQDFGGGFIIEQVIKSIAVNKGIGDDVFSVK